ncbi:MAG: hypothetical protein JSU04_06335 [Bdellovibrionales bacterium]|nr:hypothetical protein [Bdellovibrionales bacterium]
MQLLIYLGVMHMAFAGGEFRSMLNLHTNAVAATKAHVIKVGEAQARFKKLTEACAPKNIDTQPALLGCGQNYLQMNLELQSLKISQANTQQVVAALPSSFSTAKTSLSSALAETDKILSLVIETPLKTANALFAMNSVYVQKQFEQTRRDANANAKLNQYCGNLQAEIDTLVQLAQFASKAKSSFVLLYKQNLRLQNTLILSREIAPVCKKSYNTANLELVSKQLSAQLTPNAFSAYKKVVCSKPSVKSGLTTETCGKLPLTPYSIQWLEIAGGRS